MTEGAAIGVMGGTFDPIHTGHLVAASEVADRFALDRVIFVPAGRPWQKTSRSVADPEHRYLMTVIATAADERFEVSRVDIDRPGLTYSVDTLTDLRDRFGDRDQWYYITGSDALAGVRDWRDPAGLLRMAHLIGVTRPGHDLAVPGLPEESVSLLEIPALSISSTDIRQRLAQGRTVRYLVPEGVERYLGKTGLYTDD